MVLVIVSQRKNRDEKREFSYLARPIAWTPHVVAITSKAPVSWCSTATHSAIPLITVAMPSKIWNPKLLWIASEAGR